MSPELAGGFLTTGPLGKSCFLISINFMLLFSFCDIFLTVTEFFFFNLFGCVMS